MTVGTTRQSPSRDNCIRDPSGPTPKCLLPSRFRPPMLLPQRQAEAETDYQKIFNGGVIKQTQQHVNYHLGGRYAGFNVQFFQLFCMFNFFRIKCGGEKATKNLQQNFISFDNRMILNLLCIFNTVKIHSKILIKFSFFKRPKFGPVGEAFSWLMGVALSKTFIQLNLAS